MSAVTCEEAGSVWRLRLNRPEKLNALNREVLSDLEKAFGALADRPDVAVAVLSGEGRAFSAGADLHDLGSSGARAARTDRTWVERRHGTGRWQRLLDLIERVPQVTVASIHGHCVGGAALLAVACDIRIAADDTVVRIPEVAIGVPLTWAGIPRLAREVGLPMARDLVMSGRAMASDEAKQCGFVQRVVPAAELERARAELEHELTAMPRGALALTRDMFAAMSRERLGSAAWADADLFDLASREPESVEAGARYIGRRGSQAE